MADFREVESDANDIRRVRLVGADAVGQNLGWELVAVSDVDGDGRFEIVTRRRNCSGRYCTGTDVDIDHDFSEEDGDRFTYFRRPAVAAKG